MDHHLVLILAEVLNRIVLTGVAIKGRDHELLEKFIFQYNLGEGVGCIGSDSSESAVMRHHRFFDSLMHKLVKILDTDKLFGLSPRMVVLIHQAGM